MELNQIEDFGTSAGDGKWGGSEWGQALHWAEKKGDDEVTDALVFKVPMMDECHPAVEAERTEEEAGGRQSKHPDSSRAAFSICTNPDPFGYDS